MLTLVRGSKAVFRLMRKTVQIHANMQQAAEALTDPAISARTLFLLADQLKDYDRSATKAIPLYERALELGVTDSAVLFKLGQLYAQKWEASRPLLNPMGQPNRVYLERAIAYLESGLQQSVDAQGEMLLAQLYADHRVPNPERAIDFAFEQMDARKVYLPLKEIILAQVAHIEPKIGGIEVVHVLEPSLGYKKLPNEKQQRVRAFLTETSENQYLAKITPQQRRPKGSILGLISGKKC